jgi:hypothetical protein
MGRKKKRNKWSAQPRKQQNPLAQQPQQLVAPKAVRDYWNNEMTAEERELINTPIGVAQHAGIVRRLGFITATFYHLHSVQSILFAEMENIIEKWGLYMKGVQPSTPYRNPRIRSST